MRRFSGRGFGRLDRLTLALLAAGVLLLAASLVGAAVLLAPPSGETDAVSPNPAATPDTSLPPDRVATVLYVDAADGAGSAARAGDHVDVLGYFTASSTGGASTTRLLLQDVAVLGALRSGSTLALTLAVSQDQALLMQEAQALGAHPYVALRSAADTTDDMPASFSAADLAKRLGSSTSAAAAAGGR